MLHGQHAIERLTLSSSSRATLLAVPLRLRTVRDRMRDDRPIGCRLHAGERDAKLVFLWQADFQAHPHFNLTVGGLRQRSKMRQDAACVSAHTFGLDRHN